MRVLVYGAGNIGCLYAARLARSGEEVSVLARGARLESLRARGIELEDSLTGERTTTAVVVVERLDPGDPYDLVLVALPGHRVHEVLPVLAENDRTPAVLFFGNNVAGAGEMVGALGQDRVLLGFPGAAGFPSGGRIRYLITSAREQPTTIGELDGRRSPRVRALAAALRGAGFPVVICPQMEAWLKTHSAEMVPTVAALYMAAGDRLRMVRTRDSLVLMLRAIREGYRVLRRLDIRITPAHHRLFEWLPEPLLLRIMKKMLASDSAAVKIGHAAAARSEWRMIADDFRSLAAKARLPTPALDRLYRYLDPAVEAAADGSAQIRPSWRPRPLWSAREGEL